MDASRVSSLDEQSRRFLEATPLPAALLTPAGDIVHLNAQFVATFGHEPADIPNLEAWWPRAYPDPDYRRRVIHDWCGRLVNIKEGQALVPYEARVTCRDGTVRSIEWRGTHLGSHVLVLGADLTEHQRATRALQASEARYRLLLDTAPEAIVVFDVDLERFVECNAAAERLFKAPREELYRLSPGTISPPTQPNGRPSDVMAAAYVGRALAGEVPVFSWMHRDREGRDFPCEIRLLRLPDPTYRRLVRGSILDISARKQAEDTLRENEERFRLLVENSTELVAQVDQLGNLIYASPNHLAITGYAPEEMIGHNVFDFIHADDAPRVRDALRSKYDQEIRVFRFRFKDGSWHWLESAGRRFRTSVGHDMAAVISRDITQRVSAEDARKRLEAQLRQAQKMEAIGTLAGGIAHDFNNILTGLFGNLQLAESEIDRDHPARPMLTACFRACVRARDLVAKVLTFSRRREQQKGAYPLGPIIREAAGLLRASLPATVEIRPEVPVEERSVFCDPVQIHQVLMNLGTNAAYAMRERGGVLAISLDPTPPEPAFLAAQPDPRPDRWVRLTVSDTGCGMDPATRDRIFEPFFTTKPVGEGTGLGLAVVHGIVENHHGTIAIDTAPGVGTTFRIWLPTVESVARPGSTSPFPLARGQGERVLFVDDESAVCEVGAQILRRLGYEVTAFQRPTEALEAFRRAPDNFQAVVSDLTMPEMTGVELAREIYKIRPKLPLLITTGFMRTTEVERIHAVGIKHYLEKPFTVEHLAESLRRALAGE